MKILSYVLVFGLVFSLVSCKNKGEKADVAGKGDVAKAEGAKTFAVDAASSVFKWEGYKPTGTHNGTIGIKDGNFKVENGELVAGSMTLDMANIEVLDLEGEYKADLEAHLRGTTEGKENDFFNTTKFPTAKFEITKVTKLINSDEATHMVYGNLTIKEVTKEVGFKANVDIMGGKLMAKAPKFNIDRTDWDIKFMSKTFDEKFKDKFINDEIGLEAEIVANAK
jgi:polyisoprenoid-binding protein YceI